MVLLKWFNLVQLSVFSQFSSVKLVRTISYIKHQQISRKQNNFHVSQQVGLEESTSTSNTLRPIYQGWVDKVSLQQIQATFSPNNKNTGMEKRLKYHQHEQPREITQKISQSVIWGCMTWLTLERSSTNALNVTKHSIPMHQMWHDI